LTILRFFPSSLAIILHNRSLWPFAVLLFLLTILPGNSLGCAPADLLIIAAGVCFAFIAEASIVHSTQQASIGIRPTFRDSWRKGTSSLASLLLLLIPFTLFVILYALLYRMVLSLFGLQHNSWWAWIFRFLVLIPFGLAFFSFAVSSVVILRINVWKATLLSLMVATNNLPRIVLIGVPFSVLRMSFSALATAITGYPLSPDFAHLHVPFPWALAPLVISIAALVLLAAWEPASYTLAYLQFIKAVPYPWISGEAAA
jgi:hypothetical protein